MYSVSMDVGKYKTYRIIERDRERWLYLDK